MDRSKRFPYPSWTAYFPKGNIRTEDGPLPSDSRWCKSGLNGRAFKQSELLLTEELQQVSVIVIVSLSSRTLSTLRLIINRSVPTSVNQSSNPSYLTSKMFPLRPCLLTLPTMASFQAFIISFLTSANSSLTGTFKFCLLRLMLNI